LEALQLHLLQLLLLLRMLMRVLQVGMHLLLG